MSTKKTTKKTVKAKKPAPTFDQLILQAIENHFRVKEDDIYDIADAVCYNNDFRNLIESQVKKVLDARKAV